MLGLVQPARLEVGVADGPRLLRALTRRLEADTTPATPSPPDNGAKWIAAAILAAGTLIAAAHHWG